MQRVKLGHVQQPRLPPMKLYVTSIRRTRGWPAFSLIEKGLEDRVEIVEAKTRTVGSPYYQINPSGRVPYLVDDAGIGMEDSQLICAYLDSLDGKPRFHHPSPRDRLGLSPAGSLGAQHV